MYGINLRFVTPMIGAVIGAAAGGLLAGITGVKGYTMGGSPSILTLICFIGGDNPMQGVIFGAIAGAVVLALSCGITIFLFKDPEADEGESEDADAAETKATKSDDAPKGLSRKVEISAPLSGQLVNLENVPDAVFASGAMGKGVAIVPSAGRVVAPCDGVVSATLESKHAVGITTPEGIELLIHVGLDTVNLGGKHYVCKVRQGQEIKRGDVLIEFDMDAIKAAGYRMHTPVLVTNPESFSSVMVVGAGDVAVGEELLTVS